MTRFNTNWAFIRTVSSAPKDVAFIATSFACLIGSAAFAGPLDEPHLNIIPRTAAEAARIAAITAVPTDFSTAARFEELAAGAATVRAHKRADAFFEASANISFEDELDFKVDNGLFRKLWVSDPSSTLASDGLGPLYNARSCQRCHIKDGRRHPPEADDTNAISIFVRVSIPGTANDSIAQIEGYLATLPDPNYGSQLQDFAVQGHPAEYKLGVTYTEEIITLSGGETAALRHPTYTAQNLGCGPPSSKSDVQPSCGFSNDRAWTA